MTLQKGLRFLIPVLFQRTPWYLTGVHNPIIQSTRLPTLLAIRPERPTVGGQPDIFNPIWLVFTDPVLVLARP